MTCGALLCRSCCRWPTTLDVGDGEWAGDPRRTSAASLRFFVALAADLCAWVGLDLCNCPLLVTPAGQSLSQYCLISALLFPFLTKFQTRFWIVVGVILGQGGGGVGGKTPTKETFATLGFLQVHHQLCYL